MTRTFKLIMIIAMIAFVAGCRWRTQEKELLDSKIEVDVASVKAVFSLSDLVADTEYIFLETGSHFLVGGISKIIHRNNCFYILDGSSLQILVFRETGEFLYSINKPGRGPGEYLYINAFDVTRSGDVLIFDSMNSKLFVYSEGATRQEEFKLEHYFYEMAESGVDGQLLIRNQIREGNLLNSFAHYSYKTGELSPAAIQNPYINEFFNLPFIGVSQIFRSGDRLLFHNRFTGEIYESHEGVFSLFMRVKGEFPSTENLAEQQRSQRLVMPDWIIYELYNIFCTEHYVFFRFVNGVFHQTIVASTETGKALRIADPSPSGESGTGFFGENRVMGATRDRFFTILNISNTYNFDDWQEKVASSGLDSEMTGKLLSLTTDDNPVIITFKLNPDRFIN
jgi:hypothetical protein